MNEIVACLKENQIKPSFARIKIMEFLREHPVHPTVEEIYHNVVKEIPTLSKTTVYNTLDLFVRHNLARVITIEENETRYDGDVSNHGHFKCESCQTVYDFSINPDTMETRGLSGFAVKEKHIYFLGICKKCL